MKSNLINSDYGFSFSLIELYRSRPTPLYCMACFIRNMLNAHENAELLRYVYGPKNREMHFVKNPLTGSSYQGPVNFDPGSPEKIGILDHK